MSLRAAFADILTNYAVERTRPLAGSELSAMVRNTLADGIRSALGVSASDMIVKASVGNGNWAEVPWAAVFEPSITTSATRGYYPVYLFNVERGQVHLSLNQGTTVVRAEFANRTPVILAKRADLMRDRLADIIGRLPVQSIELPKGRLGQDYAMGHALGKTYSVDALPSDAELQSDLTEVIASYRALIFRGGLDFDAAPAEPKVDGEPPTTVDEERQYRAHKRIERNRKAAALAKQYHGTACQCCMLDFSKRYGSVGVDFIEVHHLIPIASLKEGTKVAYSVATDFAVLCANCHRMIHRMPDPSDVQALRSVLIQ